MFKAPRRGSNEPLSKQLAKHKEAAISQLTPERRRVLELKAKAKADEELREAQTLRRAQRKLREDYTFMIGLAAKAGRFGDMFDYFKMLIAIPGTRLSFSDRSMLQVAVREYVGSRRVAWQKVMAIIEVTQEHAPAELLIIIVRYAEHVRDEIVDACRDTLDIVADQLPRCTGQDHEAKACLYKVRGDCERYLCEGEQGERRAILSRQALTAYTEAKRIAQACLPVAHPTRLGIMLNLAILYHETFAQVDKATTLLKVTFDETIDQVDDVHRDGSEEYVHSEDTTVMLGLLRRTLTQWTGKSKYCHLSPPKAQSVFAKERERQAAAAAQAGLDWNRTEMADDDE